MDTSELMKIVQDERLETPVLYGEGALRPEVGVLERDGSEWKAFVANERGGVMGSTLQTFDTESDALDHVLEKARQGTEYHRALAARSRSHG